MPPGRTARHISATPAAGSGTKNSTSAITAASTIEASTALWQAAGLKQVRTGQFTVQRRFESFDDYWHSATQSNTLRPMFDAMPAEQREQLLPNVRNRLQAGDGPLTLSARANAVCGIKA